jgi:hypothetical protein
MEKTATIYQLDGREQTLDVLEAARLVGPRQVGAGKGWSFVKPPPLGWEREVPKYRVRRDLLPAERDRYRFESPFDMGERWQYGTRAIKAGEIIETKDWPHASFIPLNYGAERVLAFFNTAIKSRMTNSPWHFGALRLDDGMSGPIVPAIDVPPPQSQSAPPAPPQRVQHSMRRG